MICDHILAVTHQGSTFRYTITRLSMPLFFLISGHLVKRNNWTRLSIVGILGILIPSFAYFIEAPNVLFWYALSAPIIVAAKDNQKALCGIIVFSLTMYANGFFLIPGAYSPFALMALMAVGKLIPSEFLEYPRLPKFLKWPGKFPLSIYVGHILILSALAEAITRVP